MNRRYDWALHFNSSFNDDLYNSKVYLIRRGLRKGQNAFFQGLLRKEGDTLVLKCGRKSDLIISLQSIKEAQKSSRKNGFYLLLLGSFLLAGGIYRFLYLNVFYIHFQSMLEAKQE